MSQRKTEEVDEKQMRAFKNKIRLRLMLIYIGIAFISATVIAPAVINLGATRDPYIAERSMFAWYILQRDCHVEEGRDATWYGKWATWKCADGTEQVSKFSKTEMEEFIQKQKDELGLESIARNQEPGLFDTLNEYLHGIIRVNLNTFLILVILIQVTVIHYKLR